MYMLQYTVLHFNTIKCLSLYQNTLYAYCIQLIYTEWPKKMYTLFTHQYLWNKFK